jgi:hypothetical protein
MTFVSSLDYYAYMGLNLDLKLIPLKSIDYFNHFDMSNDPIRLKMTKLLPIELAFLFFGKLQDLQETLWG